VGTARAAAAKENWQHLKASASAQQSDSDGVTIWQRCCRGLEDLKEHISLLIRQQSRIVSGVQMWLGNILLTSRAPRCFWDNSAKTSR